ncbi:MAG: hypothetical protein ACP5TY_02465, partial [Thermodesulforhabdaceae bacterium]
AVMKECRKTAMRVFDNLKEAEAYIEKLTRYKKTKYYIERIQPEYVRCLYFCNVARFCNCLK